MELEWKNCVLDTPFNSELFTTYPTYLCTFSCFDQYIRYYCMYMYLACTTSIVWPSQALRRSVASGAHSIIRYSVSYFSFFLLTHHLTRTLTHSLTNHDTPDAVESTRVLLHAAHHPQNREEEAKESRGGRGRGRKTTRLGFAPRQKPPPWPRQPLATPPAPLPAEQRHTITTTTTPPPAPPSSSPANTNKCAQTKTFPEFPSASYTPPSSNGK